MMLPPGCFLGTRLFIFRFDFGFSGVLLRSFSADKPRESEESESSRRGVPTAQNSVSPEAEVVLVYNHGEQSDEKKSEAVSCYEMILWDLEVLQSLATIFWIVDGGRMDVNTSNCSGGEEIVALELRASRE